jgi:hypothetical protein
MYFSAACLIGMRPVFSHLPRWVKDRVLHQSDGGSGEAHTCTGAMTRLRSHIKDHYSSINGKHGIVDEQASTPLKHIHVQHSISTMVSSPKPKSHDSQDDYLLSSTAASSSSPPRPTIGGRHHSNSDRYGADHCDLETGMAVGAARG